MERPEGGWWRGYRELGPSKRVSGWFPATHVAINATQQVPMLQNQAIYETPTEGVHRPTRTPSPTTPTPVLRQRKASVTALMQDKRSTLNAEIEKELRVRAGAENMLTVRHRCLSVGQLPVNHHLPCLSGLSQHEQATTEEARRKETGYCCYA
jgi:hypothetical protein